MPALAATHFMPGYGPPFVFNEWFPSISINPCTRIKITPTKSFTIFRIDLPCRQQSTKRRTSVSQYDSSSQGIVRKVITINAFLTV